MKRKAFLLTLVMMMAGMTGCGAKELALVSDRVEVELGSELDTTVTKYVDLEETAAADVSIDFSAVDVLAVGTYTATVISGDQTAEFEVDVVDTTAPAVEVLEDVKVAAGMPLYAKDVITDITELSGNAEVKFTVATSQQEDTAEATESVEEGTEEAAEETETAESTELPTLEETFKLGDVTCQNAVVTFEEVGEYDVSVIVADASGNETTVPVRVIVGDVPVFSGIEDLTVALGTDAEEVDYLDGVTAVDCNGNDLTEDIVCDSSAVDLTTAGEYEITYTVTDENGFKAEQTAAVTVEEKSGKTDAAKKNTSSKTDAKSDTKKNDSTTGTSGNNNSGTSANVNASSGNTNSGANTSSDAGNNNASNTDAGNAGNNSSSGANAGNTSTPSADTGNTSTPSGDTGNTSTPSGDTGNTSTPTPETPSTPGAGSGSGSEMQVPDGVEIIPEPEGGWGSGEDLSAGDGTSVWN